MKTIEKQAKINKQLFYFTSNLQDIVKKEGWIPRYDFESDSLSFSVKKLPSETKIKYLDNELAFYISSNNEVKGLFIEYFLSNFLSHNKEFAKIRAEIKKKKVPENEIVELKNIDKKDSILILENLIKESLANSIKLQRPLVYS